jgi:hypothetical protein
LEYVIGLNQQGIVTVVASMGSNDDALFFDDSGKHVCHPLAGFQ